MINLWIDEHAYQNILSEANEKYPFETGGILAGYRTVDDRDVVVTDSVGPGPNAVHELSTFTPDYDFHRDSIGSIYDSSSGLITYLGDWHSHPDAFSYLSKSDKRALHNISSYERNYIDNPVMLVISCCNGPHMWDMSAWRITESNSLFFLRSYDFKKLSVIFYDGSWL